MLVSNHLEFLSLSQTLIEGNYRFAIIKNFEVDV